MERRLAAILSADVVGYSRLIGVDEAGTLTALRTLLKEVVEPTLKRHRGRVVKLMGDGLLAEFASVVDAVAAAVEIQESTTERSAHLPENRRIALRIGVNIGDVVVENGDLFGDGVNIAARLQEVADPNGVVISDDAYRHLRGKLDLRFVDTGEKDLKNIVESVRTWMWSPIITFDDTPDSKLPLTLPDKPSIAVLPFDNLSADPEQEFFADGISEDIITALSKFSGLLVIARNSTFTYKGKAVNITEVARDLGVRYVLEGSVRKAAQRIRVTGQLIDAETGNHIWAERYDRELDDLFAIQDEITRNIVAAIEPEIGFAERRRAALQRPDTLDAWAAYQIGVEFQNSNDPALFPDAEVKYREAIKLSPKFAAPYSALAVLYCTRISQGHLAGKSADNLRDDAESLVEMAIERDPSDARAHISRGRIETLKGNHELALASMNRAIALNPNSAAGFRNRGSANAFGGSPEAAIADYELADRLSPKDPQKWIIYTPGAWALLQVGRYEEAIRYSLEAEQLNRHTIWAPTHRAAALVALDRPEAAREALQAALRRNPSANARFMRDNLGYQADQEFVDWFIDQLKEVGLPE